MSGKNLFGKDGAFAPMLKNVIEKALEAEMEGHLDEIERFQGNKRNGRGKKTIKSGFGTFDIDTPQDRQSNFEPELVKKRQTILADNLRTWRIHQRFLPVFPLYSFPDFVQKYDKSYCYSTVSTNATILSINGFISMGGLPSSKEEDS